MRSSIFVTLASIVLAASIAACGSTTEGCVDGSCGGSSGGSAGSAGSGGGSGGTSACDLTPKSGEIPCDVFAVIHDNCHSCHADPVMNGAPFPLLTYADTQEPYGTKKLVFHQMYDQIQPGAAPRMPINGMLTDAEQKTLSDWLAACAPPAAAGMGCGCPGNGCD